jgi:hypothetical protein
MARFRTDDREMKFQPFSSTPLPIQLSTMRHPGPITVYTPIAVSPSILVMVATGMVRHFFTASDVVAESARYEVTPEPGYGQLGALARREGDRGLDRHSHAARGPGRGAAAPSVRSLCARSAWGAALHRAAPWRRIR